MKKIIFINLITVIFFIIFFEFLLRFFNIVTLQGYDKGFFYSEKNITFNKANVLATVFGEDVKTDEHGFRIPVSNYKFNHKLESVLILGDSVSFGVGVKEKNTFVGKLRNKINKNVFNSSVIGLNLSNYSYLIKNYKNRIDKQFTDVIIFLCLNDIHFKQGVIEEEEIKNLYVHNPEENFFIKILKNELPLKLNFYLRDKSVLFIFLKSITTNPIKRHFNYMSWLYSDKESLNEYREYIKQIINSSSAQGLNLNFVLLPYAYQINNDCDSKLLKPQIELQRIFDELQFKLYDLTKDFCSNSNKKNLFLKFDPVHLSIYGHEFVSTLLIEKKIIYF
jgi:lysophospholipase L1-like esterase